jgi:uncharacterized protein HemY
MDLGNIGKLLLIGGGLIAFVGLVIILMGKSGIISKLPGDIIIQRGDFTFYFPIVTFIIISVVLTIIINVVLRLFK